MRTVILLAGLIISDALAPEKQEDKTVIGFFAILLMVCIIMDIVEFIKNIFFNNND
ncbi:MAG: hypothetical protein LBE56_12285 [Tannerella sp.]|jgi:hypothetical protein|nr:hypothetical protein [Tannerella sp.]